MCGASPPCCLCVLTTWCLRRGTACQWRNLIRRSGIAEGYTIRHCTVPLDLPCVSGFATDSSGKSFMCPSEKHRRCTSDRPRQLHLESSEHETVIDWRPVRDCAVWAYGHVCCLTMLSTAKNTQCHLHMSTEHRWNTTDRGNRSSERKTWPSATERTTVTLLMQHYTLQQLSPVITLVCCRCCCYLVNSRFRHFAHSDPEYLDMRSSARFQYSSIMQRL